jgi:hypothetical protein
VVNRGHRDDYDKAATDRGDDAEAARLRQEAVAVVRQFLSAYGARRTALSRA